MTNINFVKAMDKMGFIRFLKVVGKEESIEMKIENHNYAENETKNSYKRYLQHQIDVEELNLFVVRGKKVYEFNTGYSDWNYTGWATIQLIH